MSSIAVVVLLVLPLYTLPIVVETSKSVTFFASSPTDNPDTESIQPIISKAPPSSVSRSMDVVDEYVDVFIESLHMISFKP